MGLSGYLYYKANSKDKSIKGSGAKWPSSYFVYERRVLGKSRLGFYGLLLPYIFPKVFAPSDTLALSLIRVSTLPAKEVTNGKLALGKD